MFFLDILFYRMSEMAWFRQPYFKGANSEDLAATKKPPCEAASYFDSALLTHAAT